MKNPVDFAPDPGSCEAGKPVNPDWVVQEQPDPFEGTVTLPPGAIAPGHVANLGLFFVEDTSSL